MNFLLKEGELERLTGAREAETKYLREQNQLEVDKAREMGDIETSKFKNMVDAIGASTLESIASAGPQMQVCIPKCIVKFHLSNKMLWETFTIRL